MYQPPTGASLLYTSYCTPVRRWREQAAGSDTIVQVDLKNAFNNASSDAIFSNIAAEAPHFLPYARLCYANPTPLLLGEMQLESAAGVQQGDPCGPLFFALALHPLLLQLSRLPLKGQAWYLDDGHLFGPASVLQEAVSLIRHEGPKLGLVLNTSKSIATSPEPSVAYAETLRDLRWVPWDAGLSVLGCPVGSPSFEAEWLASHVDKVAAGLEHLQDLGHPQAAVLLLRYCHGTCKINHLLRSLPFELGKRLASAVTELVHGSLSLTLGQDLSPEVLALASFPISYGGLGITDASQTHAPAYIASQVGFLAYMESGPSILEAGFLSHVSTFLNSLPPQLDLRPRNSHASRCSVLVISKRLGSPSSPR